MKFCSECGNGLSVRIPEGDHLPRHVCDACKTIHYQNPKIVAGCIAEWQDKILLCRRAIEPQLGRWTLPAGFMENGETTAEAAKRETWEEAQAKVSGMSLFGLFNLPHINQVYILFRGTLVAGQAAPGAESLDVALLSENEIPWEEIAFPVIREALQRYYEDLRNGNVQVRQSDIVRHPDRSITIKRY